MRPHETMNDVSDQSEEIPLSSFRDPHLEIISMQVAMENDSASKSGEGSMAMPQEVNPARIHDAPADVGHQDLSAFYPEDTTGPGCSGQQLQQTTDFATIPPSSNVGQAHHQIINASTTIPHPPLPGTAYGQFLPLGAGTPGGEQTVVMPAYIISAPSGQPYGQTAGFQGQGNFPPVQHIVISIPGGAGLPNASSNMGMSSSFPPHTTFQPYLAGIPESSTTSGGNDSVLRSTSSNQNPYVGGYSLIPGSVYGGHFEAMNRGAFHTSQEPTRSQKKSRKHQVRSGMPPKVQVKRSPTDRRYNSTPISLVATSRCEENEKIKLTGMGPMILFLECDTESLSEYQCFLRKQIEIFEANDDDLQWNAQKMNKGVVLGQVGIRCRHCTSQPPWFRTMGAVYYAATLDGLYQAGQNMSKNHLSQCAAIPENIRQELLRLKEGKRRASGGKYYWAEAARAMGVIEDRHGLRFSERAMTGKEREDDGGAGNGGGSQPPLTTTRE